MRTSISTHCCRLRLLCCDSVVYCVTVKYCALGQRVHVFVAVSLLSVNQTDMNFM